MNDHWNNLLTSCIGASSSSRPHSHYSSLPFVPYVLNFIHFVLSDHNQRFILQDGGTTVHNQWYLPVGRYDRTKIKKISILWRVE